jgi:hypothetical protein
MVNAGDHCSRRMSRQIEPLALILQSEARQYGYVVKEISKTYLGW